MTAMTVGAADVDLEKRLADELDALRHDAVASDDETRLSVRVTDETGTLVGGLTGWTWGGCGGITSLWVAPAWRGRGWGGRLLDAAEREMRRRGCTRVAVAVLSFQAPGFYVRYGYAQVGRTPDMPDGVAAHHFHKRLDGTARVRLVAVVDASEADAAVVRGYEDRVLGLLARHGGVLEQRLFSADGCTEMQTISFADEAGYQSFLADPQRAAYRAELGGTAPRARVVPLA